MRALTKSKDKGVAGLNVLLSIIVALFMIGLVVMIFTLSGNEMRDASYDKLTSVSIVNETTASVVNETGVNLTSGYLQRDALCTVAAVINQTGNVLIAAGNYTATNCNLAFNPTNAGVADIAGFNNTLWNVTYTYTWTADNEATDVMNDTVWGLNDVTDWFSIIIVIGAMVVLILLTVIIITAIRGSGITGEGGMSGPRRPGQGTGGTA